MFASETKKPKETVDYSKSQNKISEGTKIVGDVISEGGFRVEGTIEGTFKTSGKVVVGKSGFIKGTLECSDADFEGKFSGNLMITGTLTLKATANIEGDVIAGKLAVEPGATFNASCTMKGNVKSISQNQNNGNNRPKQGQQAPQRQQEKAGRTA